VQYYIKEITYLNDIRNKKIDKNTVKIKSISAKVDAVQFKVIKAKCTELYFYLIVKTIKPSVLVRGSPQTTSAVRGEFVQCGTFADKGGEGTSNVDVYTSWCKKNRIF